MNAAEKASPGINRPPINYAIDAGPPVLLDSYRALPRLSDWFEQVRTYCADPAANHERAAEWLLDNDYQVKRALLRLQEGMPPDFYLRLPAMDGTNGARIPRVFAVSNAVYDELTPQIIFTDLVRYIDAFQMTTPLTNAEVWAIPSMLRLVCIERLIHAIGAMNAELLLGVDLSEQTLATPVARPVDQIARVIANLVTIDTIKWADFVDEVSCIEAELSKDPAHIYAQMTFETRDSYRKTVERLGRRTNASESEIARKAVVLSQKESQDSLRHHVGYWLIGDGLHALEAAVEYRPPLISAFQRQLSGFRGALYALGLSLLVVAALMVSVVYLWVNDATWGQWIIGVAATLLPATIPSVWVGHWLITRLSRPKPLPELDFSKAIPSEFSTAIVLPVIVASEAEVEGIAEKLEILRLANPDPALTFVVLSDPVDAPTQTMPDDPLIEIAFQSRIAALNLRYGKQGKAPFILLHRARQHNPSEGCWMAWERKRGKLEEFNRFVLGEGVDAFNVVAGPVESLRGLRYAITLDADTQLPPGTTSRLIGIIAHPLNRAVIDPQSGRVTKGYAILQPRIEILPKLEKNTHFSHLYGGDTAVDIYSRAVSNVYQDLFGTGIYVGKGIYDIAVLHRSTAGRIPQNSILSHDLFEGLHARAALVSNLVLYEDMPATYPEFAQRQHRWMRGDWQLVPWLGRRVPDAQGGRMRTTLTALDRWKMVDNLRRSLTSPALLLLFLGAWLVLPGSALVWTVLVIAAPGSYLAGELFAIATGGIRRGALGTAIHKIKTTGGRWFFTITFLVSDTLISLDAIFRTLWRLYVTGKKRLEWTSAAHVSSRLYGQSIRRASWNLMWPSSALAAVLAGHLALNNPSGFWSAIPVLILWLLAPEISVWTARPRYFRTQSLKATQRAFLTLVARRTWHFFETFVGPDDNWLPPDNYQFGDKEEIAHRTSPTNIGMFLTSALAARDLNFITVSDFVARSRNTLDTLERMTRYRGHLLNWYNTQTLAPLEPQYVSTVDSGNLAVALIALKQGCLDLVARPAFESSSFGSLETTLDLLCGALREVPDVNERALRDTERAIRRLIAQTASSPLVWKTILDTLGDPLWQELETTVRDTIEDATDLPQTQVSEITTWLERFHHDLHAIARDIDTFLPWLSLLAEVPAKIRPSAQEVAEMMYPSKGQNGKPHAPKALSDLLEAWRSAHPNVDPKTQAWLDQMQQAIHAGLAQENALHAALGDLAQKAGEMAYGMDFTFLYDSASRLFFIGYNHSLGKMDSSHYDLLATEARLASYFAIAKHDAPIEHWFAFTRPITRLQGKPSILSWNGSMFEYLMPPLFLPSYRDTLLGESELTAVEFQREYARARGVPWGISESAFGITDAQGTYQYRAFGVPGLGIRRGLTEDLVVAPYGSALALCGWPQAAAENLRALSKLGVLTRYGFIEALDYTPDRAPRNADFVPVETFMAHHQGMVQVAIVNALRDDIMVKRFLQEKAVKSMDLLLQERVPWDEPLERGRADEGWTHKADVPSAPDLAPWLPSPDFVVPQVHLLGNGRMASLITDKGGGGLSWGETALTRWRADSTRTATGMWCYLEDADRAEIWSLGAAPSGHTTAETKVVFHQHMVEFLRRHAGIVARMDVTVAPYDDVEIRRVTLVNEGDKDRTINLTTYAEVVLAPPLEDERHPAFSKLFVKSTYFPKEQALFFKRRPRRPEARPPALLHKLISTDPDLKVAAWETDRRRFLGRNQREQTPQGLREGLSGTTGWTLDPVLALQVRVRLKPMETKELTFLTVAGTSRKDVVQVAKRYPVIAIERTFRDALFETARAVHKLGIEPAHLPELQLLSSLLVHAHQTFRAPPPQDTEVWKGQSDLWRFAISGDLPILLLEISHPEESALLDVLLRGHRLWHDLGLHVDFVILRDATTSYEEPLREKVLSILSDTNATSLLGMRGGVHLLAADQLEAGLRRGMEAAAHVVLRDQNKSLGELLDRALNVGNPSPPFEPVPAPEYKPVSAIPRPKNLLFDNTYGGFDPDNSDYVIHLSPEMHTPAPWCNVLANDDFGCLTSEAGLGATWAINSGEHRLTPWSNDPVADVPCEVVYLRDEANSDVWTTTPMPMGMDATCQIRHGAGFTQWRQNSHGLAQKVSVFVPVDGSVKLVRLHLNNKSGQARRISATYYAEWLLGALDSVARPHVSSRYDPALKAIIGRNRWNAEFGARVAFLTASLGPHSVTGSRSDFLGHEGDVFNPDGLRRWDLGGRFVHGGDACGAYQVHLDIPAGAQAEVVFALGEVANQAALAQAVERWQDPTEVENAWRALQDTWVKRLGSVQVKTPDPAFDLMVNRWLPYQNRSCRIMARAGFYQAGGAYGFRDQLQDVLALLLSEPQRVRQHILLAARYQFEEGDVLHWWHPPEGRGVRTHCSDDYLWLVYVTARYVAATGDMAILDVKIPFLSAPELRSEEHDRYALFEHGEIGTLYEHCARALDRMMETGAHGLPLMGTGDWNDGMDRIGDEGRGESVWLAWFQIATVTAFAPVAQKTGREEDVARWRVHTSHLENALSTQAWDGDWYRRAFDDEGLPWGASENEECRIDLIAQAWSVLSGLPADARALKALTSAGENLVDVQNRLIRLLTPPFDKTDRDPGYIRAYPPGIRENGGQYTHAAVWLGVAYVAINEGDLAHQVFDIINPIRRATNQQAADLYQREPYVLAGDVSGVGAQTGQGGWSWYTGAAGWTFQLGVEGILGMRPERGAVRMDPCLPTAWAHAEVVLDCGNGRLEVVIENPDHLAHGQGLLCVDGSDTIYSTVTYPGKGQTRKVVNTMK
ncbi:glucoamylase family protein [Falsihalocynthiibacter sp. S25ZX9]|uniref:GH36-type glycosyl hydrolase domain-containing protein n=1 Tax=Falsihalocynthiibacter sp. S25ZX9 TaxID=3240870 RepID=UPI003510A1A1